MKDAALQSKYEIKNPERLLGFALVVLASCGLATEEDLRLLRELLFRDKPRQKVA